MKMGVNQPGSITLPFARFQHQMIDWMELMHRQHTMHGLIDVDVTDARRIIRELRGSTGEPISFTAFTIASLARAVAKDRRLHAYRKGRDKLVLFEDVDVAVVVEREVEREKVPVGLVIRGADKKAVVDIHREMKHAQTGPSPLSGAIRWLGLWLLVPAPLRRWLLAAYLRDPTRRKRLSGTVVVTAVGMFGAGAGGWGIPLTDYTLCLTIGGIARKPAVVRGRSGDERIEPREILSLTISLDHDVVDGAPAARFAARLKEMMETGAVLEQREGGEPVPAPP